MQSRRIELISVYCRRLCVFCVFLLAVGPLVCPANAQGQAEVAPGRAIAPGQRETLSAEEQAARDAEFERLVAEAEAYELAAAPKTPEEAVSGVGPKRAERLRLYRAALAARPNDPRNADVLYRIGQACLCSFDRMAGEEEDVEGGREAYEQFLAIADERCDRRQLISVQQTLASLYTVRVKNPKRAMALSRSVLMRPFPDIDSIPEKTFQEMNRKDYNLLSKDEQFYLVLELGKGNMLKTHYASSLRVNNKNRQGKQDLLNTLKCAYPQSSTTERRV